MESRKPVTARRKGKLRPILRHVALIRLPAGGGFRGVGPFLRLAIGGAACELPLASLGGRIGMTTYKLPQKVLEAGPRLDLQRRRCPTQKRWDFNECRICTHRALECPRRESPIYRLTTN